jgi:hypothetical protein
MILPQVLEQLKAQSSQRYVSPFYIALLYAGLGSSCIVSRRVSRMLERTRRNIPAKSQDGLTQIRLPQGAQKTRSTLGSPERETGPLQNESG